MHKILIVGSGASGVHFALSVLKKGCDVTMLDVGYRKPDIANPNENINELKTNLEDPVDYFLGNNFESFISPDNDSEYYGFPPNKSYVFSKPPQFSFSSSGFAPLFSYAQGGLSEVWTGGAYPLNNDELSDFPFSVDDLLPYYCEVAKRIGISGTRDDLEMFYPFHENIMEPLALDQNSSVMLSKYDQNRYHLNKKLRFYMGRSRIATLSRDKDDRKACASSGRCLWGCPGGALYTPSITLEKCKRFQNFHYISDMYVRHFRCNTESSVTHVIASSTKDNQTHEFPLNKLVLAAGTLSSSRIFLESVYKRKGKIERLNGLMDNQQILIPFLNLRMIGEPSVTECYQYHQLAIGLKTKNPKEYVHGQITTLKSALIHPIVKNIPFDLKTSVYIFRNFHSALGLININFPDHRRDENHVSLKYDNNLSQLGLTINYVPIPVNNAYLTKTVKTIKKALLKLGCIVPPGVVHIRPMGASVHYSGTIPMSAKRAPYTVSENCQSHDFENLYIVDGTTFPFLPSKNLTFTLMANAARVADTAF